MKKNQSTDADSTKPVRSIQPLKKREAIPSSPSNDSQHTPQIEAATPCENLSEIEPQLTQILGKLELLQADFETKIKYDSSREQMIDRLHEELHTYKDDLTFSIKKPILLDLIRLYDDLGKVAKSYEQQSETVQSIQTFQEDVEDIMYRHSVEPFNVEQDTFDPKRQKVLKRIETTESTQHLHIALRRRTGFTYEDKVIRPELVDVYAHSKPKIVTKTEGADSNE